MKTTHELTEEQKQVKKLIESLVSYINSRPGYETSRDLWAILTALRGPDSNQNELKDITTARIRFAIGLDDSGQGFIVHAGRPLKKYETGLQDSSHFFTHSDLAIGALERLGYIGYIEHPIEYK